MRLSDAAWHGTIRTSRNLVALAALALAVITAIPLQTATAQEELPVPGVDVPLDLPDVPPPPQEQPRNRPRRPLLDALAAPRNAAPPEPEKLNDALELFLAPLVEGDPAIRSLHIELDPQQTDLLADRVLLRIDAELNSSQWSNRPSELWAEIDLHVEQAGFVEDDLGHRVYTPARAMLIAMLTVDTDILGAVNEALPKLREQLARREERDPLAERVLAKLETTGQVASMDELADLFTYISAQQFLVMVERIDALRAELAATDNADEANRLQREIQQLREQRDQMLLVHPSVQRDDRGEAVSIAIHMAHPPGASAVQVDRLLAVVTADGVEVETAASLNRGVEMYALFKPMVLNTLATIQNADRQQLEAMLQAYLPLLEQLLGKPGGLFGEPR